MRSRVAVAGAVLVALTGGPARPDGLALPTLALQPAPDPSLWSGLHVGTEVSAVSGRRGAGGGFGGAVTAGYDRAFANRFVLGVEGATGRTPFAFGAAHGFDFAQAEVRLGYDMGRAMPFVTGGVALLKPDLGPGLGSLGGADSLNALVNGTSRLKAAATVGAGVDYAVTDDLHVGVAVSLTQAPAPLAR